MEVLIIDRSKWRTGSNGDYKTGLGTTALLNDDGYMCCLGFFCLSAGLEENDIRGAGTPQDAFFNSDINLMPVAEKNAEDDSGRYMDTSFCETAVNINDSAEINSETREIEIKEHFATVSIEVQFIGEYKQENILA